MRIDKYLKISRLIKRRELAAQACESGRVLLNDKQIKPGARVAPGDTLELRLGNAPLRVKVLSIAENARKEDAFSLYEVLPLS